jgi:HEPN domain-containing protein
MITHKELRKTALERLNDAEALLTANRFDGAMYICGYAVEIALKAKICTTSSWIDFPLTAAEFKIREVKTHSLEELLKFSGESTTIKSNHFTEWSVVSAWSPESRYKPAAANASDAQTMIDFAKVILGVLGVS